VWVIVSCERGDRKGVPGTGAGKGRQNERPGGFERPWGKNLFDVLSLRSSYVEQVAAPCSGCRPAGDEAR
jgi:hypothetical protein